MLSEVGTSHRASTTSLDILAHLGHASEPYHSALLQLDLAPHRMGDFDRMLHCTRAADLSKIAVASTCFALLHSFWRVRPVRHSSDASAGMGTCDDAPAATPSITCIKGLRQRAERQRQVLNDEGAGGQALMSRRSRFAVLHTGALPRP